jgi:hypothetical protein
MECKEFRNQFSSMHDGFLPEDKRNRFETHLGACSHCASEWEVFKESLSSLRLLGGEKAPEGFREEVLKRLTVRRYERKSAPWQLLLSPAGAVFCIMFLVAGMAVGFFAGKQSSPFPADSIRQMADSDGIFLLPGKGGQGFEYALVPIQQAPAGQDTTRRVMNNYPRSDEVFIGGNENAEIYLRPAGLAQPESSRFRVGGNTDYQQDVYRALLEQSH